MKMDEIVKLLANRVNQPHVIEQYLKKVAKGSYEKGVKDTEEKLNTNKLYSIKDIVEVVKWISKEDIEEKYIKAFLDNR